MEVAMRVFYTSENGDEWLLVRDENEVVSVVHRPNPPSGGQRHIIDLSTFLAQEPHSAQNQSLQRLLATLVAEPEDAAEEAASA